MGGEGTGAEGRGWEAVAAEAFRAAFASVSSRPRRRASAASERGAQLDRHTTTSKVLRARARRTQELERIHGPRDGVGELELGQAHDHGCWRECVRADVLGA